MTKMGTIALGLLVCASSLVRADPCSSHLLQLGLSQAAVEALRNAEEAGYYVQVMSKRRDGRSHTIVLLGESHHATAQEAEAGRNVVAAFDYRAVEGVSVSRYWTGELHFRLMEANRQPDRMEDGPIYQIQGLEARAREACQPATTVNRSIWLEEHHVPCLIEQLAFSLGTLGLHSAMQIKRIIPRVDTPPRRITRQVAGTLVLLPHLATVSLLSRSPDFSAYFRNNTMANRLAQLVEEYPNQPVVLVTVGKHHVFPIARRLLRHDYAPVVLEP